MQFPSLEEIQLYSKETMQAQVEWARNEFHFPGLNPSLVVTNVRTGPQGQARSLRKGGYQVKLGAFLLLRSPLQAFEEYRSYNHRIGIGGFKTNDWKLWIDAVMAHELAHVVQFMFGRSGSSHPFYESPNDSMSGRKKSFQPFGYYEDGHGLFFQAVYRRFRDRWVNHRLTPSDYTCPDRSFAPLEDFEERLQAMPPVSIQGMTFKMGSKSYVVAGRNPQTTAKLFGFHVRDEAGNYFRIKLIQLSSDPAIMEAILKDPLLSAELHQNANAHMRKLNANRKSSHTKARRAAYA